MKKDGFDKDVDEWNHLIENWSFLIVSWWKHFLEDCYYTIKCQNTERKEKVFDLHMISTLIVMI